MSIFSRINRRLSEGSTWGGAGALAIGVNEMLKQFGAEGAAEKAGMAAEAAANAGMMVATGMNPLVAIGLTVLGAFGILSPTSKKE